MPKVRYTISKYAAHELLEPIISYVKQLAVGVCYKRLYKTLPDIEIYVDRLYEAAEEDIDLFADLLAKTFLHEYLHYLEGLEERNIKYLEELEEIINV